jgi:dihydrofolate synthase / folylpolyglutamate synthase
LKEAGLSQVFDSNEFEKTVQKLESLQIMPKTMPGLEKINSALNLCDWKNEIDPQKIIVVAGTNGKGSTCAALEKLLVSAGQNVGLYTSPHLISTNERIRVNGIDISPEDFVAVFCETQDIIAKCELSHFEALTLMMGHYFFSKKWNLNLDFVILEVGLGGLYDATNAFPHKFNVITKLGLDHVNILGHTLPEIAKNKFGIVGKKSIIVHQKLASELHELKHEVQRETNSNWIEVPAAQYEIKTKNNEAHYFMKYEGEKFAINLPGKRGAENVMTAITAFEVLGFNPLEYLSCLREIRWAGRMQKVLLKKFNYCVYLSGDHNEQGMESLVEILNDLNYSTLHLVLGIGVDKDADAMFREINKLKRPFKLYLTETPFKGRTIEQYPQNMLKQAEQQDANVENILLNISRTASSEDICVVSGSLYLVGEIYKLIS